MEVRTIPEVGPIQHDFTRCEKEWLKAWKRPRAMRLTRKFDVPVIDTHEMSVLA